MKLYGGIDLHSNNNVISLIDENDQVIYEKRLPNNLDYILLQLAPFREQIQGLVVESTFNWYWLVDGLMENNYQLHLANTAAIQQYSGLKLTNDETDARWLAHLLRLNILPEGYIYPKDDRALRDTLRKRMQMVRLCTIQILSIQNLVIRNTGKAISGNQIKTMDKDELNRILPFEEQAFAAQCNLAVFATLNEQVATLESHIIERLASRPEIAYLKSVAGVGKILSWTIYLETGNIKRFGKVGQYASYCRCVESKRLSNHKKKGENNRKNGNKYLSWAYVEAANFAQRYYDPIKGFYQRKKAKTNGTIAIKAIAHKLARASYFVMRDQVPFDINRSFT